MPAVTCFTIHIPRQHGLRSQLLTVPGTAAHPRVSSMENKQELHYLTADTARSSQHCNLNQEDPTIEKIVVC